MIHRIRRWVRGAWVAPVLAIAILGATLTVGCGGSGDNSTPTPVPTPTADMTAYADFSPEAAMLTVDDLPPGFAELERRPPALGGPEIVSGALHRFATESASHYVFSEVVLLNVRAEPVVEEFLSARMRGLDVTDVASATVDYPKDGSTFARASGVSGTLLTDPPVDTDIPVVFEVVSFAEGNVTAMVGRWYPTADSPEPSLQALSEIVLDRISAQIKDGEAGQGQ